MSILPNYKILFLPSFEKRLKRISDFIVRDKRSAAENFKVELKSKISDIAYFPKMYKKSIYYDNENVRDMTFKGYTIVYKIESDKILIADIFKWIDK